MNEHVIKNKTISLRLSAEEYERVKTQYRAHGARTVSELARQALQDIVSHEPMATGGITRLAELEDRVHALEFQLAQRESQDSDARL